MIRADLDREVQSTLLVYLAEVRGDLRAPV
jgi:hypothetical protein